jgi:hypothetical protein
MQPKALTYLKAVVEAESFDQRFLGSNYIRRRLRVCKGGQYPVGKRPFDATLDGLMMNTKLSSDQKKRRILTVGEQHLRPLHLARRLRSRAGNNRQLSNLLISHRQLDRLPPSCHVAIPRPLNRKRGIHQLTASSMSARFMESIV